MPVGIWMALLIQLYNHYGRWRVCFISHTERGVSNHADGTQQEKDQDTSAGTHSQHAINQGSTAHDKRKQSATLQSKAVQRSTHLSDVTAELVRRVNPVGRLVFRHRCNPSVFPRVALERSTTHLGHMTGQVCVIWDASGGRWAELSFICAEHR